MTEPRKTPRTDRYCESEFANYGPGYVNPANFMRTLEIETQELALSLAALLESSLELIGEPPERNCSCHLSPPCNDCVDHNFTREMLENARAALARHRVKQEVKS